MSFFQAVGSCLRQYADFSGRARRSEFWWFIVFHALVRTAASAADQSFGWYVDRSSVSLTMVTLALLLPLLAVSCRRLHDTGHSGWSLLLVWFPVVGWILLFAWAVNDSDPRPNPYGASPKAASGPAAGFTYGFPPVP